MADLVKLDSVINELESQSKELLEVNKLLSEVATLKDELAKSLVVLEENNKGFESVTENLRTSITQSLEQLASKVDELYGDNKRFYKELDSLLHSLLEKHKSDIQVEVRNEGQQIKKYLEEAQSVTEKKLKSLESSLQEANEKLSKKSTFLIVLVLVTLGVSIFLVLKSLGLA